MPRTPSEQSTPSPIKRRKTIRFETLAQSPGPLTSLLDVDTKGHWSIIISPSNSSRTIYALCKAPEHTGVGPSRFEAAIAHCQQQDIQFPKNEQLPAHFVFAGFDETPFAPHSPWASWPNLAVFTPDILFVEQDGITRGFQRDDLSAKTCLPQLFSTRETPCKNVSCHNTRTDHHEKNTWTQLVNLALDEINKEKLTKLVPARNHTTTTDDNQRWALADTAKELQQSHQHSTFYAIRSPQGETFIGASPELLIRTNNTVVESMALAGTASVDEHKPASSPPLSDDKTQREHEVVRNQIISSLASIGVDSHATDHAVHADYGSLQHLRTPIRGVAPPSMHPLKLVQALHPTPAVSGAPVVDSVRWLAEHEPMERGYYAGPFGTITSDGNASFHVALRCALFTKNSAHIFAGAGIVAGSDPDAEWEETRWKLSTMASSIRVHKGEEPS